MTAENPQTKEKLLAAALKEFAENGLAGARVDRIVRAAGVNKQAVYYYFQDKDDLYRAVLERCYELAHADDEAIRGYGETGAQAMEFLLDRIFTRLAGLRDVIAVVSDENRNRGKHLPNVRAREINRPLIEAIAEILRRGAADGTLRAGIDAEQLWITILSSIMFYFSNIFTLSNLLARDLDCDKEIEARKIFVTDFMMAAVRSSRSDERAAIQS